MKHTNYLAITIIDTVFCVVFGFTFVVLPTSAPRDALVAFFVFGIALSVWMTARGGLLLLVSCFALGAFAAWAMGGARY